jgi:hypothetical protein
MSEEFKTSPPEQPCQHYDNPAGGPTLQPRGNTGCGTPPVETTGDDDPSRATTATTRQTLLRGSLALRLSEHVSTPSHLMDWAPNWDDEEASGLTALDHPCSRHSNASQATTTASSTLLSHPTQDDFPPLNNKDVMLEYSNATASATAALDEAISCHKAELACQRHAVA